MATSIIGAGYVGMALAKAFIAKGKTVVFGAPDPAKYATAVAALGPNASVGPTDQAIASGATSSSLPSRTPRRKPSPGRCPTGKAGFSWMPAIRWRLGWQD